MSPFSTPWGRAWGCPTFLPARKALGVLADALRRYAGRVRAVVRPGDTTETAAVVRLLAGRGVPIVPQGGHIGLAGERLGPLADQVAESFKRYNTRVGSECPLIRRSEMR